MTTYEKPDAVYYGPRDAMIAEVSTPSFYDGKYLAQIVGAATWDAEGFSTLEEARDYAEGTAAHYGVRAEGLR